MASDLLAAAKAVLARYDHDRSPYVTDDALAKRMRESVMTDLRAAIEEAERADARSVVDRHYISPDPEAPSVSCPKCGDRARPMLDASTMRFCGVAECENGCGIVKGGPTQGGPVARPCRPACTCVGHRHVQMGGRCGWDAGAGDLRCPCRVRPKGGES